jgi:hypothetical protein
VFDDGLVTPSKNGTPDRVSREIDHVTPGLDYQGTVGSRRREIWLPWAINTVSPSRA